MSDMLQLVVKIIDTQVPMLPLTSHFTVSYPDDKLKHIGHLVVAFLTCNLAVHEPPY